MKQLLALTLSLIAMSSSAVAQGQEQVIVGAERTELYLPLLENKRVGILTNNTGRIGSTHLVDSLYDTGVDIRMVFAPEHGFRGDADAGEHIDNGKDPRTGIQIVSVYGANKAPSAEYMDQLDVVVFDIQDVGLRYYTYLSSMHYMMQACADNDVEMIVLDRPNPNGFYVDGPILDPKYRSFVGMHPIPVVHGMTLGELRDMSCRKNLHRICPTCARSTSTHHYAFSKALRRASDAAPISRSRCTDTRRWTRTDSGSPRTAMREQKIRR